MCEYTKAVSHCCEGMKSVSPGLCSTCPQCRSDFNMKVTLDDFEFHSWFERDRSFIGLRDKSTHQFDLIELWDDDVSGFVVDWGLEAKGLAAVESALREHADQCDLLDNVPEDIKTTILEDKIADQEYLDEGSFSWSQCDSCGSTLGGNRYAAHGFVPDESDLPTGEVVHLDICEDCLCFHANGDIPENWEG